MWVYGWDLDKGGVELKEFGECIAGLAEADEEVSRQGSMGC